MKITEALKTLQQAPNGAATYDAVLVCGFTPLHLETFLAAHLQQRRADRRIQITTGTYGDVAGTVENLTTTQAQAVAVVLEWQDLDARLGFRGAGKWGPTPVADMLVMARGMLQRIASAIRSIPPAVPVGCVLPTLPLPPVFHTAGWQTAEAEMILGRELLTFAEGLADRRGFSLANERRLAEESPAASRYDLKSDLATGLPYSLAHADAVSSALANLLSPPVPKKGLITDLDDTLWHGLVGEVGPEKVCWDLASHRQLHGLYQKLLASLAEEGILIGIASKNDAAVAGSALRRDDILLPLERVFPVEVHWAAKSGAVDRILRTWNIGADAVVFVDDSPMELAEVAAAHPGIECVRFPATDPDQGYAMLRRLRDLFGRPRLSKEDTLRIQSIRQGAEFQQISENVSAAEVFLQQAEATITLEFDSRGEDPRMLELVNKTNQFNLNGVRYTETEWTRQLARPGAVTMSVSYQDKFGPLGKIAVFSGCQQGDTLYTDTWVMSCRAFSRRIEYQCLKTLFELSGAEKMVFAFQPTPKNGPLQDFFEVLTDIRPEDCLTLSRGQFLERCPALHHRVTETASSVQPWIQSQRA